MTTDGATATISVDELAAAIDSITAIKDEPSVYPTPDTRLTVTRSTVRGCATEEESPSPAGPSHSDNRETVNGCGRTHGCDGTHGEKANETASMDRGGLICDH